MERLSLEAFYNNDAGLVFSFDQANKLYTDLHDFDISDGQYPRGGLIELISTGIPEHKNIESIQLYPNPASDQLTIKSSGLAINRIEIYNMLGEKVYTKSDLSNSRTQNRESAYRCQ